jgi:UDP-N-acetylmuramate--alanine ligase
LKEVGQKYRFTIQEYGKDLCKVQLNVRGICNVYNALAAFAVMRSYGFSGDEIVRGLESFSFVKRRFEELGEYRGVSFVCDYAHHPREIMSTISTARGICAGKLYVVFQPHTYSRTKLLMQEFVEVLREIEELIVYKTYAAREYYDEEGSARTLAENVGGCLYLENMRELKSWIKRTVKAGDMILFLGAGDVYYVAERILFSLNKRKK